jgi:hypothetical protein
VANFIICVCVPATVTKSEQNVMNIQGWKFDKLQKHSLHSLALSIVEHIAATLCLVKVRIAGTTIAGCQATLFALLLHPLTLHHRKMLACLCDTSKND